MASRQVITFVSDFSGAVISAGADTTVHFGIDDDAYEIDLTQAEARELRAVLSQAVLSQYVTAARTPIANRSPTDRRDPSVGRRDPPRPIRLQRLKRSALGAARTASTYRREGAFPQPSWKRSISRTDSPRGPQAQQRWTCPQSANSDVPGVITPQ